LCFWSKILVNQPIDILKHVIGKTLGKSLEIQCELEKR